MKQTDLLLLRGGCYCGHITYEITEAVLKKGVCHCHSCQKLTGGACWPFLLVKSESLQIHGQVKYITRQGDSGHNVHVSFCPECGTTLFGRPEAWPSIRTVSASTLDKAEDFIPDMHVWTEDRQTWISLSHDVVQFLKNRTRGA